MIEICHDLHQNPELPNRGFRIAGIIADHLKSLKLDDVRTEVEVTGVVGVLNRLWRIHPGRLTGRLHEDAAVLGRPDVARPRFLQAGMVDSMTNEDH